MEIARITVDRRPLVNVDRASEIVVELLGVTVTITDAGDATMVSVSQHATGDSHGITVPHKPIVEETAEGGASEITRSGIATSSS